MNFVFHGGSGSEKDKIELALKNGVVKMNIDTDTQWAFWDGIRGYEVNQILLTVLLFIVHCLSCVFFVCENPVCQAMS